MEELEPFKSWSQGSFCVQLSTGTCDYSLFQSLHFPCRHALPAYATASVKWGTYVHLMYRQEAVFKVHEVQFLRILDEKLWPEWFGIRLRPNPSMCRKATGRPVFPRFHNEMDEGERQEKRCGLCRQTGHTRRVCPN
ncbi:hypothetical protein Ahy_A05g022937 [Arachis hypogaea]|uniref:SWIM-type domain-containing protein n=1 Tax=Arachis hypogaea TaxID=3818 RepID=A0A445D1W7_ARAHY|nr:hypothetical protein Ahy_A05g022937 [Arachis hypogaea]